MYTCDLFPKTETHASSSPNRLKAVVNVVKARAQKRLGSLSRASCRELTLSAMKHSKTAGAKQSYDICLAARICH